MAVSFHFRFYCRYTSDDPRCALFLEIDDIPDTMKVLRAEVDIKCIKKKVYQQLLNAYICTGKSKLFGFQTFPYAELDCNDSFLWRFAVKISAERRGLSELDEADQYLFELTQRFSDSTLL